MSRSPSSFPVDVFMLTEYRGPVDTAMLRKSYELQGAVVDYSWLPLGRAAHQNEVPPLVEFLLTDASSFITGNAMPIDGGWYR